MDTIEEFKKECAERVAKQGENKELQKASQIWMETSIRSGYSYNFSWMGRPIIQYPQDMIAMQELIWTVQPDLIIETGIAHGGSLIFYASILELIGKGEIIGIDIDIRSHNKIEIQKHPMFKRIELIEGSSISPETLDKVNDAISEKNIKIIMVLLDSNHTHQHVLREMELYSPFVSKGSYLIVFDTIVEDLPSEIYKNRGWSEGNNPKTAVKEFLKKNSNFIIDSAIENKILLSVAPSGYLQKTF